jgi:hypothetical protein
VEQAETGNGLETVTNRYQEVKAGNAPAVPGGVISSALDDAWNALTRSSATNVQALTALADTLQDTLSRKPVESSILMAGPVQPAAQDGLRHSLLSLALLLRHTERNLLLLHGAGRNSTAFADHGVQWTSRAGPRALAAATAPATTADVPHGRPTIWHH